MLLTDDLSRLTIEWPLSAERGHRKTDDAWSLKSPKRRTMRTGKAKLTTKHSSLVRLGTFALMRESARRWVSVKRT